MGFELTRRHLAGLILGAAGAATVVRPAAAAALPVPAGKTVLTITGKIHGSNAAGAVKFDRAGLESLGMESFETKTPWYPTSVKFEGVAMARLMTAVGAFGTTVTATALNDYVTEIPIADFATYNVLLALKRNDEYMSPRDKGPLFIIYPFDSEPELRHQRFYSRSAWQVATLAVR